MTTCTCKSVMLEGDGSTDVVLDLPDWVDPERQSRTVCADRCIAKTIKYLWDQGVETLGCCCGHGKENPNIVIPSGNDPQHAYDVLAEVDTRQWDVYQWQLIKTENADAS
jgi:hypothetical protein